MFTIPVKQHNNNNIIRIFFSIEFQITSVLRDDIFCPYETYNRSYLFYVSTSWISLKIVKTVSQNQKLSFKIITEANFPFSVVSSAHLQDNGEHVQYIGSGSGHPCIFILYFYHLQDATLISPSLPHPLTGQRKRN